MEYDIALTEGTNGGVLVHRADCPTARTAAMFGQPVATLLGCQTMPSADIPRHDCLTNGVSRR